MEWDYLRPVQFLDHLAVIKMPKIDTLNALDDKMASMLKTLGRHSEDKFKICPIFELVKDIGRYGWQ